MPRGARRRRKITSIIIIISPATSIAPRWISPDWRRWRDLVSRSEVKRLRSQNWPDGSPATNLKRRARRAKQGIDSLEREVGSDGPCRGAARCATAWQVRDQKARRANEYAVDPWEVRNEHLSRIPLFVVSVFPHASHFRSAIEDGGTSRDAFSGAELSRDGLAIPGARQSHIENTRPQGRPLRLCRRSRRPTRAG